MDDRHRPVVRSASFTVGALGGILTPAHGAHAIAAERLQVVRTNRRIQKGQTRRRQDGPTRTQLTCPRNRIRSNSRFGRQRGAACSPIHFSGFETTNITLVASGSPHRNGVVGRELRYVVADRDELIRKPKGIVRRRHLDVDVGDAP